jgi:hypothetical protein
MLALTLLTLSADPVPELAALRQKAAAFRPNRGELRWQELPWLTDADAALSAARAESRPLFVWLAGGRGRDGSPLERC